MPADLEQVTAVTNGRRFLVFVGLSVGLLILALIPGNLVQAARPDCVTCGANVTFTYWVSFLLALQPVVWAARASRSQRAAVWLASVAVGAVLYISLEALAVWFLHSSFEFAIGLGFAANLFAWAAAFATSRLGVQRLSRLPESAVSVDGDATKRGTNPGATPPTAPVGIAKRRSPFVLVSLVVAGSLLYVAVSQLYIRNADRRDRRILARADSANQEQAREREIGRRRVSLKLVEHSPPVNPRTLYVRICNNRPDSIGAVRFTGSTFRRGRSTLHSVTGASLYTDRVIGPRECVEESFDGVFTVLDSVSLHVTCVAAYTGRASTRHRAPRTIIDEMLDEDSCRREPKLNR